MDYFLVNFFIKNFPQQWSILIATAIVISKNFQCTPPKQKTDFLEKRELQTLSTAIQTGLNL
jgi:hypothetical protein